jgi:phosphoribosylformylglycinamidine synthase subunit PurSL
VNTPLSSRASLQHSPTAADHAQNTATRVHRVEVRTKPGLLDPRAEVAASKARRLGFGVESASSARVYLIEAPLSATQLEHVMQRLLADPVVESARLGAAPATGVTIEVHPLPGVMDPAAQSVREAILDLTGLTADAAHVSTGVRYDLTGLSHEQAERLGATTLGNPAIHQILTHAWMPEQLPKGHAYAFTLVTVPVRSLDDAGLMKLSKDGHLFLNLQEMQAIRIHFQQLGRDATDIELETLAQTWSEHCVHKTLKARVRYVEQGNDSTRTPSLLSLTRPGFSRDADGSLIIDNLLKRTVAAATHELIAEGIDWTLSVFKDNSGVIAFDDQWGVCIKVETHNRPSAIEPYGGAATGIGGCIRDVIGTGLGAKPIASTDVFCVAHPSNWHESSITPNASRHKSSDTLERSALPPGVLHPRRVLTDVVAGVRDYGNRMGIPTVTGGVFFDDRYVGNPLVFCGCIGLIPRSLVHGNVQAGDRIIALGGRTGRDGIHGATFSSGELQSTSATEFSHAVQIGNAIEEKRVLDVIVRARHAAHGKPLYTAMTDCGAGGFSSAVGEMGSTLGARVTLEAAPLKYAGLRYDEIWISEAQERMVLSVPASNVAALQRICDEEGVELCDLGEFGTAGGELILTYHGHEVGRLAMKFIHDGLPNPTREAVWSSAATQPSTHAHSPASLATQGDSVASTLLALLAHPTIASKHWIIRQYDHEVQGASALKPLVGPLSRGPGDASVITPVPGSSRGVALSQGLQNPFGDIALGGDPYWMTLASIDECVRNLVCVGADPARIAILDNFCWASCEKRENLGALVRAAVACYDGAKAYRTPFVSGKDSLSNQLRYTDPATGVARLIEIPPTLLITGMAIVSDVSRCVSMDAKHAGNVLLLVGETTGQLGASTVQALDHAAHAPHQPRTALPMPRVDLQKGPATAALVASFIARGLVASAHDCSEGGVLTAVAEMLIAGDDPRDAAAGSRRVGAALSPALATQAGSALTPYTFAFSEDHSRYVLEVAPADVHTIMAACTHAGIAAMPLGTLNTTGVLAWPAAQLHAEVTALAQAWLAPLDW